MSVNVVLYLLAQADEDDADEDDNSEIESSHFVLLQPSRSTTPIDH